MATPNEDDLALERSYSIEPEDDYPEPAEPEEGEEYAVDEENPDVEDLVYRDEDLNLVPAFLEHPLGRKTLDEIVNQVIADYEDAAESSEKYRENRADNWKLFAGTLPPKDHPFEDAANCHVPITAEAFTRTHSQMTSEMFGDWTDFVGVQGTGPDDDGLADTVGPHMNWQFTEDIRDFPRQAARANMQFLMGDVSAHSTFNEKTQRNEHNVLTPDELFVPYTQTSTQSDYSDCPYVCMVRSYQRHELQAEKGWHGVDKLLSGPGASWEDEPEDRLGIAVGESLGIELPSSDEMRRVPFKILHYEGWDRGLLPGQDSDRYIHAIVDHKSRKILLLRIHEQPDWKEQVRFKRQLSDWVNYIKALENWNRAKAHDSQLATQTQPPGFGTDMFAPAAPPPGVDPADLVMPVRPSWMKSTEDTPQQPRMGPVHMFTHAVCIEPMAGTHGLGYLDIVANYNRMANTALNQFTDAATLSNSWTLLLASGLDPDGDFSFGPGRINKIQGATPAGGELDKGIRELKSPPANPQLMELVAKAKEFSEGAMQSSAVLSGDPGKSGETWRGHAARLEAATKQLSVRSRVMTQSFFKPIYEKNARLNGMFLPEHEIVSLMDWKTLERREVPIGREMYNQDYDIVIRADLRFASEAQRVQEATELASLVMGNPYLQNNAALNHAVMTKLLEARRNQELVPLLGAPPPRQEVFGMPPQGPVPPGAEPEQPAPQGPPPG